MTEALRPMRPSWRWESSVAVLNGLNIVGALASQLVIFRILGFSAPTDAYVASAVFPQLVLSVVTVAASAVLVPMLAAQAPSQQDGTLGSLVVAALVVMLPVSAAAFVAVPLWVPLTFPGLAASVPDLIVDLVRVQLLALPLVAVSMLLTARWQARQRFLRTEAVNLALTVLTLVGLWLLLPVAGVMAAAWLLVARQMLQMIALSIGVRWDPTALSMPAVREAWQRSRLLIAGNTYFKSDLLVDRYLLSGAAPGSLALFSLAQTMVSSLAGVIGQAWGNTAVPPMAAASARGDVAAMRSLILRNLRLIALACAVSLPVFIFVMPPVLAWVTGRTLTNADGTSLWVLLALLAGVPVFGAIGTLVTGGFYAGGDTRTPTLISAATFTLFVAGKIWVFFSYGLYAFCVLTTVYYALNAAIMSFILRRRLSAPPATP